MTSGKIKESKFYCNLTPSLGSGSLAISRRYTLQQVFGVALLFDSTFSRLVWIDKPHDCDERVCFLYNGSYGILATIAKKKNASAKT